MYPSNVRIALLALLTTGCGFPTASSDDTEPPLCPQLAARLQAKLAAIDRTCQALGDCLVVGSALDVTAQPTCNDSISFSTRCEGEAVNSVAWRADGEIAGLERLWLERCVPLGAAAEVPVRVDCRPAAPTCREGQCATVSESCF